MHAFLMFASERRNDPISGVVERRKDGKEGKKGEGTRRKMANKRKESRNSRFEGS